MRKPFVGDGMISSESRVRENRTPGSMSGRGNVAMVKTEAPAYAKAAGNSYSLHLPLARLSSTLQGTM